MTEEPENRVRSAAPNGVFLEHLDDATRRDR
jgi:hypothetical protein